MFFILIYSFIFCFCFMQFVYFILLIYLSIYFYSLLSLYFIRTTHAGTKRAHFSSAFLTETPTHIIFLLLLIIVEYFSISNFHFTRYTLSQLSTEGYNPSPLTSSWPVVCASFHEYFGYTLTKHLPLISWQVAWYIRYILIDITQGVGWSLYRKAWT